MDAGGSGRADGQPCSASEPAPASSPRSPWSEAPALSRTGTLAGQRKGQASVTDIASSSKAGTVLLTLAAGQFLMTLDSSVMNVSIATVAEDVGTTITGIQTAITLYTLVMAMLMIPGGKVGSLIGRKRAFAIGCVIYGLGSLTTALAPNLPVLILGWSVLEGVGAALILPAIVALVAGNVPVDGSAARLRPDHGGGRHRGGRRTADRRHRDDVLLLALGLRRRGAGRAGDPGPRPPDPGRAGRGRAAARRRRRRAVGGRARAGGVRRAAVQRVGLGAAQAGRPVDPRPVADDRADPRGPAGALAVRRLGGPRRTARRRAARAAGDVRQPSVHRRPGDVLLPVPGAGRAVLHDPALPLGGARPLGDRHRPADHAAVDHPAARRGRHPAVPPERVAAPRRAGRSARDVRRDRRPVHGHGRRCRAPRS